MVAAAIGPALWLSALNVEFRDVRYMLPFLSQFLLFLTPVVYATSLVPERWQTLYGLNPMVGVIDGFRWAILGVGSGPSPALAVSVGITLFVLVTGVVFFQWRERIFVDVVGSGGR
jgi:lipopolysaccharide transport system permease protein